MQRKTYPNQIVYPRPVGPSEFVPLAIAMKGLDAESSLVPTVTAYRMSLEDESSRVDISSAVSHSYAADSGHTLQIDALFLGAEIDRPAGLYRVEIHAQLAGSLSGETVNLLVEVI